MFIYSEKAYYKIYRHAMWQIKVNVFGRILTAVQNVYIIVCVIVRISISDC